MVVILPSETWYCHVLPEDVPLLVEQHLRRGKVVTAQLYPKFHPPRPSPFFWLAIGSFAMGALILIIWVGMQAGQSKYF